MAGRLGLLPQQHDRRRGGPDAGGPRLGARGHFLDHVRSFGPLPALRCGAQPYGILPVTSLDLWQPGAEDAATAQEAWLKGMLHRRCATGSGGRRAASVARIGNRQNPPDPDADLADVMRTDAVSHAYRTRNVFGTHFLQHLYHFLGVEHARQRSGADRAPAAARRAVAAAALAAVECGLAAERGWRRWSRRAKSRRGRSSSRTTSPRCSAEPRIEQLILARPDPRTPTDTHQPAADAAAPRAAARDRVRRRTPRSPTRPAQPRRAPARRRAGRSGHRRAQPTMHWKRQLEQRLAVTGGRTIREFLETPDQLHDPGARRARRVPREPGPPAGLDSEALPHLMQGTLDLSAHRLDAWVTSFATKRLAAMHRTGRRASTSAPTAGSRTSSRFRRRSVKPVPTLPAGEPGPLQTAANDSGFIHAPSMAHAATAALLRNAHLGPDRRAEADGPFAIDLSSRRVREASRLLDGVRQGQPLGALLGYRVERLLHDTVVDNGRSLDRFIAPLRRVAPLVARSERGPRPRPSTPSPPTTSSTAWCSTAAGRKNEPPCSPS